MADDDLSQNQSENGTEGEADSPDQGSVHTLTPVPEDREPGPLDYMPLFVRSLEVAGFFVVVFLVALV